MKVGILTFHRALNYGAVLQAYALKATVEKKGHKADVIDYRNDVIESLYKYPKFSDQKTIKNKIAYILRSRWEKSKRNKFDLFRDKQLQLKNAKVYTENNISDTQDLYDAFFVGSDQVWNPDAHNFDKNFYLDFVQQKHKKHSYAASFGVDRLEEKYHEDCKRMLSDFSVCSVRESQGSKLVSDIVGVAARVDLDPVFLLNKKDWQETFNLKNSGERYVVIYTFYLSDLQKKVARSCYEAGYKIKYIGKPLKNPFGFPCEFVSAVSPVDFVELFFGASFVITNSFHGAAFSINFNKPVAIELLPDGNRVNSRLLSILNLVGMDDRIVFDVNSIKSIIESPINWNSVNSRVDELRRSSLEYIEECLSNE